MTVQKLYLRSGAYSLAGKVIGAISGLITIWLITQIGGKAAFGEIMIAYALNFILAATVAGQFQTIVLYHASRNTDQNIYIHKLGAALFYAALTGIILALIENIIAVPLAELMHKPDLIKWFSHLSWMIPAYALNSVLATWYRARQDIPTMTIYFDILPQIFRLIFIAGIFLLSQNALWIALAYIVSYLLPFIILYAKNPVRPRMDPRHFTRWDIAYSFQMMLSQLMSRSQNNIVSFVIGIFAPAVIVADYTLALRFAQFMQLPKLIITQIQMPRMGKQIQNQRKNELLKEFESVCALSLILTLLSVALSILIMPFILLMFKNFDYSFNIFLILSMSAIIMAAFGGAGNYLAIAGHSWENLFINASALAVLLIALLVMAPLYAGAGAAISTVMCSITLVVLTFLIIWDHDKIKIINADAIIQVVFACIILTLTAIHILPTPIAVLLLGAIAVIYALRSANSLRLILPF